MNFQKLPKTFSSDLLYVEMPGINNIPRGELEKMLKEENFYDADSLDIEFIYADISAGKYKSGAIAVSEDMFEKMDGGGGKGE